MFEIPQELLTSQDTRVRCGECLCIFDAMDGLSLPDQQQAQPETQLEDEVSSLGDSGFSDLDVTYSDFDLFSDDAELPEVAYLDETSDAQDLDFGAVDTSNDRTFSDTMFHHDVTINADIPIESTASEDTTDVADEQQVAEQDGVEDEASDSPDALLAQLAGVKYPVEPQVPQEPLVFDYDDEDDDSPLDTADTGPYSPPLVTRPGDIDPVTGAAGGTEPVTLQPAKPRGRKVGPWLLASTMVLSLALLLGGLYAYQERDRFGNNPRTRPLMAAACWLLRCELPA
ncbi:MAG: hypothetical protein KTR33_12495, partial [Gammaproteobacteria bacterium]|nr:hypothetical protein [Gammaproteobacteria bacterium]